MTAPVLPVSPAPDRPLGPPGRPTGGSTPEPWSLPGTQVASALDVDPAAGLSPTDAAARLEQVGPNRLAEAPPRPKWKLFVDQFRNFLIVVLVAAAVLAGVVGDIKDTIVIGVVLLINATLGFLQENRAERSLAALKQMLVTQARVRRGGETIEVSAEQLVPGDVVLLEAGDKVPADGRLLHATSVEIDESALTGESSPVAKVAAADVGPDAPLAERSTMAWMNSIVTRGRAEMVVTGTGMGTEMGRLAGMLQEAEPGPTPLQVQLDGLGKRLAVVAAISVTIFAALNLLRGIEAAEVAISSVAVLVASIPEGLPAVVTLTLAVSVHQLAKRGAIVKRLASVETLGSTSVICSDKTGTLTLNQMTARKVVAAGRHFDVSGEGYRPDGRITPVDGGDVADLRPALESMTLCNESALSLDADPGSELIGDPTEGGLLALAAKGGIDLQGLRAAHPRVAEVPFDSAVKLMATWNRHGDRLVVHVKGAPDVLLDRCATVTGIDGPVVLDAATRAGIDAELDHMAREGLRVLAIASAPVDPATFDPDRGGQDGALLDGIEGLELQALVGLLDPPRPEARDAIGVCRIAGIDVKMITGDHAVTASAIAASLGIRGDAVTGADLDAMSDEELAARVDDIGVFARVAPEHKVRIVTALKANGRIVAMTGDGVNDAPALKSADIGVAMGITGTEVTKEAATMVLTDDNFATIVKAVEGGRAMYANLVKFVRSQLSTNMGAILTLLGATIAGFPVPFTAIQVLWINIIMDGPPAMALGVDPPGRDAMQQPPRDPKAQVLNPRRLAILLWLGVIAAVSCLTMFWLADGAYGEATALGMVFTTFVLFQVFNVLNARAEDHTVFRRETFTNRALWISLGGVVLLQVLVMQVGFLGRVFDTTPLTLVQWITCVAVASLGLWLEELRKLVMRPHPGAWSKGFPE